MTRQLSLCAMLAALSSSGCFQFDGNREIGGGFPSEQQQQPTQHVPAIDPIANITWPPIGPDKGVTVVARDVDANLSLLTFEFANAGTRLISGSHTSLTLTGPELGEGYGTLEVIVDDTRGLSAVRQIHNLLVDLSPPKITLGETAVRGDGMLELWVGDGWVLGKVELERDGTVLKSELPTGFPETLGKTWDYSLVKFPMQALAPGKGPATITATDAAGNVSSESFILDIDAEPPTVSITAPGAGATVTGDVEVTIEASDPGGGPVFIELRLGGAPVGSAAGPSAALGFSTSDFVAGPAKLSAIARDHAGNETVTSVDVIVE
jgi:hypothetical protein